MLFDLALCTETIETEKADFDEITKSVLKFAFLCNSTENVGYINVSTELCYSNRSNTDLH